MKKIIAIMILSLTFGFNAKAQEASKAVPAQTINVESPKDKNLKEVVYKDIEELDTQIKLNEGLKKDLTTILFMRQEAISNAKNEEEKKSLFERYTTKFLGGLTADQLETFKKNKELYSKLTQYPTK
jgi:hypothetical protein